MEKTSVPLRWLLIASFINSFAFGFIWPLTSVYVHDELYQTMITVGWVLFWNALMQMVGSLIGGRLFDRWEPRQLLQIGVLLMILSMGALMMWHNWPIYPVLLALTGFLSGWLTAIMNSYGTHVTTHDGRFVFNMLYFIANFGMVFGTALVGPVYGFGVTWLFLLSLLLYGVMLVIVRWQLNITIVKKTAVVVEKTITKIKVPRANMWIIYAMILALVGLHTAYVQWQGNLSVYMTSELGLPLWQYSILWTINGILIAIVQLTMNALNLSASRKSMFVQIFAGLFFFMISFFLLAYAKSFTMFVIVMVITTFGEATAFPMLPALVNELTPWTLKGRYQGMMAAAPNLGRAIGPLLGGIVIDIANYKTLFYSAAGVVFIAFLGVIISLIIFYRKTTKYEER